MNESAFSPVLDRLPGADIHKPDAYGCKWLPRDINLIDKDGAVNRNYGLRSKLMSKPNRLVRRTKDYAKSVDMLKHLPATAHEERLNQPTKSISATGSEYRAPQPCLAQTKSGQHENCPPCATPTTRDICACLTSRRAIGAT